MSQSHQTHHLSKLQSESFKCIAEWLALQHDFQVLLEFCQVNKELRTICSKCIYKSVDIRGSVFSYPDSDEPCPILLPYQLKTMLAENTNLGTYIKQLQIREDVFLDSDLPIILNQLDDMATLVFMGQWRDDYDDGPQPDLGMIDWNDPLLLAALHRICSVTAEIRFLCSTMVLPTLAGATSLKTLFVRGAGISPSVTTPIRVDDKSRPHLQSLELQLDGSAAGAELIAPRSPHGLSIVDIRSLKTLSLSIITSSHTIEVLKKYLESVTQLQKFTLYVVILSDGKPLPVEFIKYMGSSALLTHLVLKFSQSMYDYMCAELQELALNNSPLQSCEFRLSLDYPVSIYEFGPELRTQLGETSMWHTLKNILNVKNFAHLRDVRLDVTQRNCYHLVRYEKPGAVQSVLEGIFNNPPSQLQFKIAIYFGFLHMF